MQSSSTAQRLNGSTAQRLNGSTAQNLGREPQIQAVKREKPETPAAKSSYRALDAVLKSRKDPVARTTPVPGFRVTLSQCRQHIFALGGAGRGGDSPFLLPAGRAASATGGFCSRTTVPQARRSQFASGKSGRALDMGVWLPRKPVLHTVETFYSRNVLSSALSDSSLTEL